MSKPVAIVTGAASGIGLAITKHFLGKGFRVAMADVNHTEGTKLAEELGPDALFHRTDVSSYESQAALFNAAFKWGGRIDFMAANAGIDDRQSLYEKVDMGEDEAEPPRPLNVKTMEVDLMGVIQGLWLFQNYARRGKKEKLGGKFVCTSSAAGLYGMTTNPQYGAAKAGLIGLVRSSGLPMLAQHNITVNCICPAFIPTNLCPKHVLDKFPKEHITPMSTALKAFDAFLADDTMTGQAVELSLENLYFREVVPYPNESQRWLGTEASAFWDEAYQEPAAPRNGV